MKQNKSHGPHSAEVHVPVPRSAFSASANPAKPIIFIIIGILMVLVIFTTIYSILNKPEDRVKARISALATDYYENYFYDDFTSSEQFAQIEDINSAMEKYTRRGFSDISLRQLFLHDSSRTTNDAAFLKNYCNENKTFIRIFPEPPYGKTDYHIEYTYSCNFSE